MRMIWRAWGLAALVAACLVAGNGAALANDAPAVHVKAVPADGLVRLEAEASGPFDFTGYRASESLYVLDLSGVTAADPATERVVSSELVKGYREQPYTVGQKPMVRLEVLLAAGVEPKLDRPDAEHLVLVVSRDRNSVPPAAALKPVVATSRDHATDGRDWPVIQQVMLSQHGDRTEVNVLASGALKYRSTLLENPARLVLDFESAHLRTSVRHIPSNLDPIRQIRLAQFTPEISRVVIDLREIAQYNITANGDAVTVRFAPGAEPEKSAPAEAPSGRVTNTDEASAPVPAPQAALPLNLTRSLSALGEPAAAKLPQQLAAPATQLAGQAAAAASAPAAQAPSAPAAAPPPVSGPSAGAPAGQINPQAMLTAASKYSGEPISVNLKDVDLRDFFRLIHEISGLNVVVDPQVKGTLTIVLDDVPWDQALDIVLRNNDLDKQLDGNVLRIATKETVKKEAEETRDLEKAQAEAADVVTTTRVLSYAKAADMAATLKKFLSSRGDILADDRSNTLIIRDVPSVLPVIDNLLRQLDRKSRQVEIEARVVAANRSFDRELGAILGAAGRAGNSAAGGATNVGSSPATFGAAPPISIFQGGGSSSATSSGGGTLPLLTNLGASVPTSGVQYLFQSTNFALDMVLDALESKGVGKLLSKPKIITQNNQKATVKQGTKIPVQTIINNTVSVQFVDAVLELDVTPQITAEGTIYMDVNIENDQIDQSIPRVEGIPAIDTQAAQTRVTVDDGATVVVGGIIVSNQQTSVSDVPVLGSVPIIGNLFKHTTVSSTAQELLFFLTPRILPG
ncbi:MAG TPA: type IV pilus secretin PilQ [Candidatus Cybelea sp.]|nr:type IV pilus secretin PilQ [Candidatus Cybelea sp.]